MAKTIFCVEGKKKNADDFPWRIMFNGKKDPVNRDFKDEDDIKLWLSDMQAAGLYLGYQLVFKPLAI